MARKKNLGIQPVIPRLMAQSAYVPETGCRLWLGATANGYGVLSVDGRQEYAHRASFEAFKRPLNPGERALHDCDVTLCIHPNHLFAGTQGDNVRDAVAKGRAGHQRHPELFKAIGEALQDSQRRDNPDRAKGARNGTHTHPERVARGSAVATSRLTESDVREIRSLPGTDRWILAKVYGVTPRSIDSVRLRRTWKHVP